MNPSLSSRGVGGSRS